MSNTVNININKSDMGLNNVDNTSDLNKPISNATQTALNGKENVSNKENTTLDTSTTKYPTNNLVKTTLNNYLLSSLKGANNGLAELDSNGKVPSGQLPSYVDDVVEYANLSGFPVTGESGKIYIALDTNLTYRWGGSTYVEISPSLALGETSSSAYRGDRGKIAYDHSQLTSGNPHNVTKSDVGLSNCDNTSDANKPISTATQTALNNKVTGVASSVNNTVAVFDGTTGKVIKEGIITDTGTNIGIGTTTPTQKLSVAGGSVTADNYYINGIDYAKVPYRYVKQVSGFVTGTWTNICNVLGDSLSSGIKLSIMGNAASTVIDVVADILVNHSQDIFIQSKAGAYTILTLRVISDGNQNFTIQATTNSVDSLTANVEVFPLNSESVIFDSITPYSGILLQHECVSGLAISSTDGVSSDIGNISTKGSVGIGILGITNPSAKLHVLKGLQSDTISVENSAAYIAGDDVGLAMGQLESAPYGNWIQSLRSTDNVTFPLLLNPSGSNVGIGTITPTEKLHVNGNIIATNLSGTNTGDQDLSGYATKNITLDRKTASYTLVANDNGKMIEMNVGSANTLTINASLFSAGNQILISQYGAGQTTITAGAGVTLRSSGAKLKTSAQYSLVTIVAISSTEFYIAGDLTA